MRPPQQGRIVRPINTRQAEGPQQQAQQFQARPYHAPTVNQRKRERRRRNRNILHQELEDLILRNTEVRIRADGEVQREDV